MKRLKLALTLIGLFSVFFFGLQAADAQTAQISQPSQLAPKQPLAMKRGYLKLKDGIERYIEWTPAQAGKPTLVLVNGLVFHIDRWSEFAAPFRKEGYGILNYYFRGQILTLRRESNYNKTPAFFETGLTPEAMAQELFEITNLLKLNSPMAIVGLSYGANIAAEFARQFPQKTGMLFFVAPLVRSLDYYNPQGAWINWSLEQIKIWWGPVLGQAFYEMAYTTIYKNYLDQRVVPEKVIPEMRDRPEIYKQSVFHLVRSTRTFDLKAYRFENLKPNTVHFMLGHEDNGGPVFRDQERAFDGISPRSKGLLIYMPNSVHAIPEEEPAKAAQYFSQIILGKIKTGKFIDTKNGLSKWK